MYPLDVFTLFPPFPRDDTVFVAISFDKSFDNRWENVIKPAIKEVGLEPYRVDETKISESLMTKIIYGIGNCRLFFADVSAFEKWNDRPLRNENVLYEVGVAHSRRLSQEVILFRSDNERLMFDLANINVNRYDPENEQKEAKNLVIEALKSALEEIDNQRHISVQKAVNSLTYDSIMFMFFLIFADGKYDSFHQDFPGFRAPTPIRGNSIHHLIDLGIMYADYSQLKSELPKTSSQNHNYKLTSFGKMVANEVASRYGIDVKY